LSPAPLKALTAPLAGRPLLLLKTISRHLA